MKKTALITGAANGLGRALAHQLSGQGYHIVALDADQAGLNRLCTKISDVTCVCMDLRQSSGIEDALDVLSDHHYAYVIQAAAISATGKFEDIPVDRMLEIVEINLYATLMLTRLLIQKKYLAPKANLIFVSSLSRYTTYPGGTVYAATKEGVAQFANGLAKSTHNFNVMCVFPGPMNTAHASRYAPNNDKSTVARRMSCEDVAREILKASAQQRRVCVPGRANRLFVVLARLMPRFVGHMLTKTMFKRMGRVRI